MLKRIQEKINRIPEEIQRMCLLRCAIGTMFLVAFLGIVISSTELAITVPPLLIGVYLIFNAAFVAYNCANEKYVEVIGKCTEIEYSRFGKKIKSVVIQHEEYKVRIPCSATKKKYNEGDALKVFIPNGASVYDKDGYKVVSYYFLLSETKTD